MKHETILGALHEMGEDIPVGTYRYQVIGYDSQGRKRVVSHDSSNENLTVDSPEIKRLDLFRSSITNIANPRKSAVIEVIPINESSMLLEGVYDHLIFQLTHILGPEIREIVDSNIRAIANEKETVIYRRNAAYVKRAAEELGVPHDEIKFLIITLENLIYMNEKDYIQGMIARRRRVSANVSRNVKRQEKGNPLTRARRLASKQSKRGGF